MIIDEFSDLKIECVENCFNLEYIPILNNSTVIKANIPKIMPLIPKGAPYDTNASIDSSILMNDSSNKPHVSSSVTTSNYLSLNPWKIPMSGSKIPPMTKFTCIFKNRDMRDYCYGWM